MFCEKCGNEVKESAAFCSRCGAQIGTTEVQIQVGQSVNVKSNRDRVVIASNVREDYEDLFAIFKMTIDPLRKYETSMNKMSAVRNDLFAKGKFGVLGVLMLSLPICIVAFLYLVFFEDTTFAGVYEMISYHTIGLFIKKEGVIKDLLIVVLSTYLISLTLSLVVGILAYIFDIIHCKKISEHAKEVFRKESEITEQILNDYREAFSVIPVKYRNSSAVSYLCEAYENYAADTLKDAIQQYEQYTQLHSIERSIKDGVDSINTRLDAIVEAMNAIVYQNDATIAELGMIRARMN